MDLMSSHNEPLINFVKLLREQWDVFWPPGARSLTFCHGIVLDMSWSAGAFLHAMNLFALCYPSDPSCASHWMT